MHLLLSGRMLCLISFVWDLPGCEEQEGSEKLKMQNIYPRLDSNHQPFAPLNTNQTP